MMQFGSPVEWAKMLDSQVPEIINLIFETWEQMPPPPMNAKEDRISESLCILLRQSRDRCELPFRIDNQMVELDPAAGEDQGKMDIVFSPTIPRENIYFCLECKRINVRYENGKIRPYFAEYVRFGMARFIRGQYSKDVRNGGMLAFVLNGDVEGAIAGIEDNMRNSHKFLGMNPPGSFLTSSLLPNDPRLRETRHRRFQNYDPIVIHHMFMAGDPNSEMIPEPELADPKSETAKPRKKARRKNLD